MRVLLTIAAVGNVYGGASKIVLELAEALGSQGLQVDVVTTNANGKHPLNVPVRQWIDEKYYRIQYFPCYMWGDYKLSPALTRWCWKQLRAYDLVHTHAIFSITNLPIYWICQYQQIPYLSTPHGMLEPWALSYKAWKKTIYYKLLEKPALNRAKAIQATASNEYRNLFSLRLKTNLISVPNGIHPARFKAQAPTHLFYQSFPHTQGKTLILFLGRIDPKKGLDLLADAFCQVYHHFPNTHLIVAGADNTQYRPQAEQFFAGVGCSNAVTFTGMLTGDLKHAALEAASIYVAPSYSEGFSMSVLEGMAAGLPCVITHGCNFPEAAIAKAARVVAINPDALAHAIMDCLRNPEKAQEMGARGREFIFNNYTWDLVAQQLIEVYTKLLSRR
jgi:glycosyltransferase involved in cell wall biosynthesis